jgi:hypothetical protein
MATENGGKQRAREAQKGGKHVTPAGKNAGNKGLIAAQNGGKK